MKRDDNYLQKIFTDTKSYIILALLIIVVILITAKSTFEKTKSFIIEDKCGRFFNLISHTINDEESCKVRCRGQCSTIDYEYASSELQLNEKGCNTCKCNCKK